MTPGIQGCLLEATHENMSPNDARFSIDGVASELYLALDAYHVEAAGDGCG